MIRRTRFAIALGVWTTLAIPAARAAASAPQRGSDPFAACRQQFADQPLGYESAYCFYQIALRQRLLDEGGRLVDGLMREHPDNFWLRVAGGHIHRQRDPVRTEALYRQAADGSVPEPLPCEIYCHSLADPTILSESLRDAGAHTLTVFGLHTPHSLVMSGTPERMRDTLTSAVLTSLNPVDDPATTGRLPSMYLAATPTAALLETVFPRRPPTQRACHLRARSTRKVVGAYAGTRRGSARGPA